MSKLGAPEDTLGKDELNRLIDLVYKHTGISMTEKKSTLLQGRLRSRLRELGLARYDDYISYLQSHPDETQEFVNRVTTNETYFFRTPRIWEYLSQDLIPTWIRTNPGKALQIWSAASSTGEEAYTLAMTCFDQKKKTPGFDFQIAASDISTEVLAAAESGRYTGRSLEMLKKNQPSHFKRYFSPTGDTAQILPEVRAKITFGPHNLYQAPKRPGLYHLVLLRNVLIYFTEEDQIKVLKNIAQALVPNGILIVGESDSLSRLKTDFQYVAPLIYRKG